MARAIENQSFGISLQMGSKRFNNILVVREFILRGGNDLTAVPHRPETMSRKTLAVAGFVMVDDLHGFQRTIGHLESAYLDFQTLINTPNSFTDTSIAPKTQN